MKENKILKLATLSLITSALLVGCGSSSSTSNTENPESPNPTTEQEKKTAIFVDAEVSGLDYNTTSGLNGTTNEKGEFEYRVGDQVAFSVGGLKLGKSKVPDNGFMTPKNITSDENQTKLLLRILQTLDSDGNSSNGIQIDASTFDGLESVDLVNFKDENELLAHDDEVKTQLDRDADGSIDVNSSRAIKHFEDTLQERGIKDGGKDTQEDQGENHANGQNGRDQNSTTEAQHENSQNDGDKGSNIGYLKQNHANYSNHGTSITPAPVKNSEVKSIDWSISATTEEGAQKLATHITFMVDKLKEGNNPRAWDKLFLMEAYMKVNHKYTTLVEQEGTTVTISKVATSTCAYDVISAHSDAVSGDFFGQGIIDKDNSATAEAILATASCDEDRTALEAYILEKKKTKEEEAQSHGERDSSNNASQEARDEAGERAENGTRSGNENGSSQERTGSERGSERGNGNGNRNGSGQNSMQ